MPKGDLYIPEILVTDQNISWPERALIAVIAAHDNDPRKRCFASNSYLGRRIGLSTGRIANMILDLRKRGYINQVFFDGKNRSLSANFEKEKHNEKVKVNSEKLNENVKHFPQKLHESVAEASRICEQNFKERKVTGEGDPRCYPNIRDDIEWIERLTADHLEFKDVSLLKLREEFLRHCAENGKAANRNYFLKWADREVDKVPMQSMQQSSVPKNVKPSPKDIEASRAVARQIPIRRDGA